MHCSLFDRAENWSENKTTEEGRGERRESSMRTTARGGGGTSYNGLYGEAPPERGTFFTLQVYERVGISRVVVYERVGKSII